MGELGHTVCIGMGRELVLFGQRRRKTEPSSSWRGTGGNKHKAQQGKFYLDIR